MCKRSDLKQDEPKKKTNITVSIIINEDLHTYSFSENTLVNTVVKKVYPLVANKSEDCKEYALVSRGVKPVGFPYNYTLKQCGFKDHVYLESIPLVVKMTSSYPCR